MDVEKNVNGILRGKLVLCVCWFEISKKLLKHGKVNTCMWFPLREQNESL
jgi:hypothetical protein